MTSRRPLILDLDGTLLHTAPAPGSLAVPGRTRPSHLAGATIGALAGLVDRHEIILATARSWSGTRPVVEGLAAREVRVNAVVLEDGGLLGPPGSCRPLEPGRRWGSLRAALDRDRDPAWPVFEWQEDFTACLVARVADPATAPGLTVALLGRAVRVEPDLRGFRDGRKVYLAGRGADKWHAIRALLGDRADSAVGVGDGPNDLCWLARVATPCTLQGAAPGVAGLVGARGGLVSPAAGHEGIAQILGRLAEGRITPPPRSPRTAP